MTITAPSGRTYSWTRDQPPTAADYAALQSHEASLGGGQPAKQGADPSGMPPGPPSGQERPQTLPVRPALPSEIPQLTATSDTPMMTRIRESLSPLLGNTDNQQLRQDALNAAVGAGDRPQTWQERGALPAVGAALGDATLGLDHLPTAGELKNMGAVTAGSAAGQVLGSRYGKPGVMLGGALGGGGASTVMELLKDGKIDIGKIVADALASANPSRGVGANATTNAVAANVNSLINTSELAGTQATFNAAKGGALGAAIAQGVSAPNVPALANTERQAALEAGRNQNMKVIPSSLGNGTMLDSILESISGRGALKDAMQKENNAAAITAARAHAGLAADEALNHDNLNAQRTDVSGPYTEAKQLGDNARAALDAHLATQPAQVSSPQDNAIAQSNPQFDAITRSLQARAGADLPALQQAMHDLSDAYRTGKTSAERAPLAQNVNDLSQALVDAAHESGGPGLIQRVNDARTAMAKTYDIEDALNHGDGSVDLSYLGRAYQRAPGKMTGPGADMGQFANAFQRSGVIGDGRVKMSPNSTGTNFAAVLAGLAEGGARTAAKMTGVPAARWAARKVLMSEPYQNSLLTAPSPQTLRAAMVRMAVENAARDQNTDK